MAYNFSSLKEKLASVQDYLASEFDGIRTSRATPAILDSVVVEAYGAKMPMKQVASLSTPDPRTIQVIPYDSSQIKDIERAIVSADLGLAVSVDDKGVRVSFPELTAERRTFLTKLAKEKLEDARIKVRKIRDDIWGDIQEKEKNDEIGEDEKFRLKDELQKNVDELNDKLKEMAEKKEKEILS